MKKSLFNILLWLCISVFLITIAFPTFVINTDNASYRIKGWDPKDISQEFLLEDFTFLPSLDLQGGNIATIDVDLSGVNEEERETKLNIIRSTLYLRILRTNPGYFELHSSINKENEEYRLLLKIPEKINEDFLSLILTPGDMSIWMEDSETLSTLTDEQRNENPLAGRKPSAITNEDIESVDIVSDSKCYFNDANTPRNFCLKLIFKPESKSDFLATLYASSSGQMPLLMVIDGVPIAVQAMGQFYSGVTPDRELLIYPAVTDTWIATAVMSGILAYLPLEQNVTLGSIDTLEPLLGINTLTNLKLSLGVSIIAVMLLFYYYFRKRSLFAIIALILFVIYDIAFMKIFNLVLDLPLIAGFLSSLLVFLSFIIYMLYRIRSLSKGGLLAEELAAAYEQMRYHYRDVALAVVVGAFLVSMFAPLLVFNFYNGFGFGIIVGLIIIWFPIKYLIALIFLKDEKWRNF